VGGARLFGARTGHPLELLHQLHHLALCMVKGARAIDLIMGQLALLLHRHLRGDAFFSLLARHRSSKAGTGQPLQLLLARARDQNQPVEPLVVSLFDQQGRFDYGYALGIASQEPVKLPVELPKHGRMHDRIQRPQLIRIAENNRGQSRAIHASIRRKNIWTELPADLLVSGLARRDQGVRHLIGVQNMATQFAHHRRHRTLATSDAARQADA